MASGKRVAAWVWFAAMLALADAMLAAWWLGSVWTMVACGLAIGGLLAAAASRWRRSVRM